jgi:hypothetical protein
MNIKLIIKKSITDIATILSNLEPRFSKPIAIIPIKPIMVRRYCLLTTIKRSPTKKMLSPAVSSAAFANSSSFMLS